MMLARKLLQYIIGRGPLGMMFMFVFLFCYQGLDLRLEVNSESYRDTAVALTPEPIPVAVVPLEWPKPEPQNVGPLAAGEQAPTAGCPTDPLSVLEHLAYENERGPERGKGGLLSRMRKR